MIAKRKKPQFPSELRLDLISKDWVVIATGRGKKPEMFRKEKGGRIEVSKKDCPFCNIETQGKPSLVYFQGKQIETKYFPGRWTTAVISNRLHLLFPYPKLETKI